MERGSVGTHGLRMLDRMRELLKDNKFIRQNHGLSWHGNWRGREEFQKVPINRAVLEMSLLLTPCGFVPLLGIGVRK